MTETREYNVSGAIVTITSNLERTTIKIHITVDLSALDADEPSHSNHVLIHYLNLPNYTTGQTYWWSKTHRVITVKTGHQARRVIKQALTRIDDAVGLALAARIARKAEMAQVWP